ncbi:acyl-CoA desaturase [Gemmata sp.]|uniref:acyl-CoA desaturase n=1 Tax=Gemmata sp. TaxID=1914242 RepID=UPI003F701772
MQLQTLGGITVPMIGVAAAAYLTWGYGFGWLDLGLLVTMYLVSMLGVTVGFHRLLTHRGFETTNTMRFVWAVFGSMSVEAPALQWVAMHRRHHQYSDAPDDPHSPHHSGPGLVGWLKGFFRSHVGWAFEPDPENLHRYIPDLLKSPSLRFANKMFAVWVVLGLLIPAVVGGLVTMTWFGALTGFIWGGLVRVFLGHHATWSVNSICHIWGKRPYESNDLSTNNALVGVVALGEGWHNNHHAFPTSARHGLEWWQLDLSWIVIRGMQAVGLAWKVKLPSANDLATRRRDPNTRPPLPTTSDAPIPDASN